MHYGNATPNFDSWNIHAGFLVRGENLDLKFIYLSQS